VKSDIKAKWVAALRSGEYKQAKGLLRYSDAFCCLGVLCDLHSKETGEGQWRVFSGAEYAYLGPTASLPERVMEWADMPISMGAEMDFPGGPITLSALNDRGHSFKQIAALIEEQL
jgi:hypothetical protein